MPPAPVKLLVLCGSPRPGSRTRLALEEVVQGAKKMGAEATVIDLSSPEWKLPLFDGIPGPARPPETDDTVRRFRQAMGEADAYVIGTPAFHDSMSGVLKNALDFVYQEPSEKACGLVSVSGGRAGAAVALDHLRAVLREMSVMVLPRQVPVGQAEESFDENGQLKDPETKKRLQALAAEVVLRAKMFRPAPRPAQ